MRGKVFQGYICRVSFLLCPQLSVGSAGGAGDHRGHGQVCRYDRHVYGSAVPLAREGGIQRGRGSSWEAAAGLGMRALHVPACFDPWFPPAYAAPV